VPPSHNGLKAMLKECAAGDGDDNDQFFRTELQKLERMAAVNEAFRRGILGEDKSAPWPRVVE